MGCHSLLQIFPTQGLNPGLLYCRQIFYRLSHQESLHKFLPSLLGNVPLRDVVLRVEIECVEGVMFEPLRPSPGTTDVEISCR